MDLEFSDVIYKVKRRWRDKGSRTLLHGISGCFRSGQLSAIMGPSGAGKSTLLNILSGYRTNGVKGTFTINGQPIDTKLFHKSSRYITQEDLLPPYLTTKEAMTVATNLKLPKTTTPKEKEMVVEETLQMLGLYESRDTRTENLSGGQKKRLSVALEMISNPNVFFLDEPTSGLDNVSTMYCIKLLKKLAKQGKTIVCTIHQPNASMFELFDNVYFLAAGKCIYQGATQQLLPFLSSRGYKCPTYHNPADFVMDIIDTDESTIDVMSKAIRNGKICQFNPNQVSSQLKSFTISNEKEIEMKPLLQSIHARTPSKWSDDGRELKKLDCCDSQDYPTSSYDQFIILVKRMLKQTTRNTTSLKLLFFHHVLCGFLIGSVFYNTARDAYQMFNHLKFSVGYILFHTYTNVMLPVLVYPDEVKLVKKEYFNRWYGLNPYFFALLITKLPAQILFSTLFSTIIYIMFGLPLEPLRFFLYTVIGVLTVLVSDGLGMAIGSNFGVTNGSAVGPALVTPLLGLAVYGFDFAREIPWFTYALMKLSFLRCGVVGTIVTIFGLDRKPMECYNIYCHFTKPTLVLHFLDINPNSVYSEIFALVIFFIFFRLVNYFALRYRVIVR